MTAQVDGEHIVYLIAAKTVAGGMDNSALGDDGDVRRTGADIDDGRRTLIIRLDTGAECSSEALFHHENFAYTGFLGSVDQRTLFHMRHIRWHAHHGRDRKIST